MGLGAAAGITKNIRFSTAITGLSSDDSAVYSKALQQLICFLKDELKSWQGRDLLSNHFHSLDMIYMIMESYSKKN